MFSKVLTRQFSTEMKHHDGLRGSSDILGLEFPPKIPGLVD